VRWNDGKPQLALVGIDHLSKGEVIPFEQGNVGIIRMGKSAVKTDICEVIKQMPAGFVIVSAALARGTEQYVINHRLDARM
jgi:hypothetical protein